jgi:GntR family transcriptional regulator of arabinose operon
VILFWLDSDVWLLRGIGMNKNDYKYEILLEFLKNEIRQRRIPFGEKIPSENELSARFSISRFTVRHAIELLTNEGWLEKRRGSGTFVKAINFEKTRTGVIGIITTYLDDYIFPSIIKGIENVLTRNDYSISLGITGNKTEKEAVCLKSMLSSNVDGLIIEGTKSALPSVNVELLRAFDAKNIPIVFINSNYPDFNSSYVLMDDEKSGLMATEYLIRNGHTRIGGIFKADDIQGHKRYKGFVEGCHASGLTLDENAVLWYTTEDLDSIFSREYDPLFIKRFMNCTAIVCYNDQIAVKTIETLGRAGMRVPQDFSLVGFDNSDLCDISTIRLTSITHAREKMGSAAAETLLKVISGQKPAKLKLPSELIVRDSVIILPGKQGTSGL